MNFQEFDVNRRQKSLQVKISSHKIIRNSESLTVVNNSKTVPANENGFAINIDDHWNRWVVDNLVELRGIEPRTSSMPRKSSSVSYRIFQEIIIA